MMDKMDRVDGMDIMDNHGQVRTDMEKHGLTRSCADKHGSARTNNAGQGGRAVKYFGRRGRVLLKQVSGRRGSAIVMAVVFTAIIGSTVAYVMLGSNRQTRNTFRARLMDTSLTASASMVQTMTRQAYYLATTRPAQLQGNFNELDNLITEGVKPTKMTNFMPAESSSGDDLAFLAPTGGGTTGEWGTIDDEDDDWYGFTIRRWSYDVVAFMNAMDETDNTKIDPVAERLGFQGAGFQTNLTINYIPLYMYAIFYDNDLEFHPGPEMDVNGPVHTNSTLWLGAGNELRLNSKVSSAGNIRSYRDFLGENMHKDSPLKPINHRISNDKIWAPETGKHPGNVKVAAKSGGLNTLNKDIPDSMDTNLNDFLDSHDSNWLQDAMSRYGGNLTDQAMGNQDIQPPLPFVGEGENRKQADAGELIQRVNANDSPDLAKAKIESVADIRITGDPSQVDGDGNLSDINIEVAEHDTNGFVTGYKTETIPNRIIDEDGQPTPPLVKPGSFRDNKEDRRVKTFDLDMEQFNERADVASVIAGGNGVIYVSGNSASYMNGVRLTDAEELPRKSGDDTLTVATDLPMYLEGDVNTEDKATLLLAADAMYVTSNHLTDSNTATKKSLQAKRTTTNAIFMLGQVSSKYQTADSDGYLIGDPDEDTIDHYEDGYRRKAWSGGVHNVFRYLEKWGDSVKHTYNGSIICLFESKVATSQHDDDYYSAPKRDYRWDQSLKDKVPPRGMPVLVEVQTTPLRRISKDQAVAALEN